MRKKKINELKGFEQISDSYWITDSGHVLSTYREEHFIKERKTKPTSHSKNKYLEVCLAQKGDRLHKKYVKVHRLVALAFVPNDDWAHKTQVNHIDQDGYNNKANNLEWTTPSENSRWSNAKKVYCYDANGLVKIYQSAKDAERDGFNLGHVCSICRGDVPKGRTHPLIRIKRHTFSYVPLKQEEVVQRLSKKRNYWPENRKPQPKRK